MNDTPADPERAAFEKWAGSRFKFTNPGPTYRHQQGKFEGEYFYAHVCAAWDAWLARSTLTPSPADVETKLAGARWLMNAHWITVANFMLAKEAVERGEA